MASSLQHSNSGSGPENPDHTDHIFPADGADLDLPGTAHASTDMSTVVEQGILLLVVTDLAEVHLLIRHLPVADPLAVAFTVLIATNIFITRLDFDKGALAMTLILHPVALVDVTRGIFHPPLTVTFTEHKVPFIDRARIRDVQALPVVATLYELATIIIAAEIGVDGLGAGGCLDRVIPRCRPKIVNQGIRFSE
jgi:hypothetical protein